MRHATCIAFLKWALPRLGLAWPGFRRVHRQVCKRISRRLGELHLPDALAYRQFLEAHPDEWPVLDSFCWISISRFYRDRAVFDHLVKEILPDLAANALAEGWNELKCCSLGCAAGEEPYSLNLLWKFQLAARFPALVLSVIAVDADEGALQRARGGCFRGGSLKELPAERLNSAFNRSRDQHRVKPEFRAGVEFRLQNIRENIPRGPFDLILCRNLVFTYFDAPSQCKLLRQILTELRPAGVLVIGRKESLPADEIDIEPCPAGLGIYRKLRGKRLSAIAPTRSRGHKAHNQDRARFG